MNTNLSMLRICRDRIAATRYRPFILIVWASLIAYVLYMTAVFANQEYSIRWPLQGDTISYWSRDLALSQTLGSGEGAPDHRTQALAGAKLNGKDPIRTAFYALLPPDAPSSVNGHLAFSAISAFLFLATLMICLMRRSGSLIYAMGASLVSLLPQGLFNPMYGMPSKLPDLPASFIYGAAVFAMFSARNTRKSELSWIFISGLLLGIATLARFQLWMYGLFILGPIAVIYGFRRFSSDGRKLIDLLIYPAALVAGLGLVAGNFIISWTSEMLKFYSIAGYALDATIVTSLKTTGIQFLQYLGISAALAGGLLLAGYVSIRSGLLAVLCKWDALAVVWGLIAYPVLLFGIMRVESIIEQTYYIVPGLLVFLLAPFVVAVPKENKTGFKLFSSFSLVFLLFAAAGQIFAYVHSEKFLYPREKEMEIAKFQHVLADLVAFHIPIDAKRPYTIDSNFNYYSRFIELPVRSQFGRNGKSLMVFQIRQSQWQLGQTGGLDKDKAIIMKELADRVDVFMALTKPVPEAKMETFVDDYTEQLALYVNSELAANPDVWENKGTVAGPYGEVTVYKNKVLK